MFLFSCCGSNHTDSARVDPPVARAESKAEQVVIPARQQDLVRNRYAETATVLPSIVTQILGVSTCCSVSGVDGQKMGYSAADFKMGGVTAEEQTQILGCGNPVRLAAIKVGETVLDLGCGKGLDCFLAAEEVGPTGKIIGVDMTPEMLQQARTRATVQGRTNCSFRLGELESLPVPDNNVDVVISNCVINLCPDKSQVYNEIMRVLKPGGRIAISDVVTTDTLPQALRTEAALAC
jgi:2-polyprenyl-3-methyl-5-hydroxy-6-metoxy-1,4-benzoquinol methylase